MEGTSRHDGNNASASPFPDLARFFNPRRVAMMGASEDLSKFGGRCMRQMIDFGYSGALYPVNPKREQIFGLPCFASLADLPHAPDHVGIVLPAPAVPAALEQCAQLGVPFATVFSSGFGEMGNAEGRAGQQRILDIARRGNIRVMGPNCNGMVNFVDGFALTSTATIQGPRRAAGDIGVVSQSGGAGQVNIMWRAQQAGLGISYQVSCGNAADLDLVDYAAFMLESPATKVVLMLAERLADGRRLRALARRADQLGKPILMVKVGRSAAGSKAAASHTGAITGADDVCDAALRQMGIVRVDDCNELYETAMLLRQGRLPAGKRAAAMSISGGNLVMVADLGASLGIEWPDYADRTRAALEESLPGFSAAANPTDLTAAAIGRQGAYAEAARTILQDPSVDVLIPVLTINSASDVRSIAQVSADSEKPVAILWTGCTHDNAALTARALVAEGHAVYRDALPCLKALRRTMQYAEHRGRLSAPPPARPANIDEAAARRILEQAQGPLSEYRSKALLQCYGLPITAETLVRTAEEAVQAAARIGRPVALKIQSPDIAHKTESGAMRLGVSGAGPVAAAFGEIIAAAKAYRPEARIEGVLVQEMIGQAREFFVGISQDATFGPILTLGLGGIHVEILRDVAFRLVPLNRDQAWCALRELRMFKLLEGARGAPPADIESLVDCLLRISWLAHDLGEHIEEFDINPLCILPEGQGARVVDALLIPRPTVP